MIQKTKHIILVLIIFLSNSLFLFSQDSPYSIDYYDFVRYDLNRLNFYGDSSHYETLFDTFDSLIVLGKGKVNVVHLGGSHIQAGSLSGRMSQRLQTFFPGLKGSRGFVFPYRIARTNNPGNYRVNYSGSWDNCRSVQRQNCQLGLSGISVTTGDPSAKVEITLRRSVYPKYDFNRVKIFHDTAKSNFDVSLANKNIIAKKKTNKELGYTLFILKHFTNTLRIRFEKTDTIQNHFTLFGISLETDEAGVTYHGIGVNGASIPCYLRCDLFQEHLQALAPDWVIMTLGTNDAYTKHFNAEDYEIHYDLLLYRIKEIAPNAALLLTVPNDSYLYRRYVNRNTEEVRRVIYKLAEKHGCAVWDFYSIMGGLNSVSTWYRAGLAARDKIHFNRRGYHLQADLLFNAFMRSFDYYLERKSKQEKISN